MDKKKVNGAVALPSHVEEKRMAVVELELSARYWKAQYEVRYYTLESEKLDPAYKAYLEAEREKNQKALEELQASIEKMNKEAEAGMLTVAGDPSEQGDK